LNRHLRVVDEGGQLLLEKNTKLVAALARHLNGPNQGKLDGPSLSTTSPRGVLSARSQTHPHTWQSTTRDVRRQLPAGNLPARRDRVRRFRFRRSPPSAQDQACLSYAKRPRKAGISPSPEATTHTQNYERSSVTRRPARKKYICNETSIGVLVNKTLSRVSLARNLEVHAIRQVSNVK